MGKAKKLSVGKNALKYPNSISKSSEHPQTDKKKARKEKWIERLSNFYESKPAEKPKEVLDMSSIQEMLETIPTVNTKNVKNQAASVHKKPISQKAQRKAK